MCDDTEEPPLIHRRYGDPLKTSVLCKKNGTIIYTDLLAESAIRVAFDYTSSEEAVIMKAALYLRKAIKAQKVQIKCGHGFGI